MPSSRQYRAYDNSGNPAFYYKDTGDSSDGTLANPDSSGVILRGGGVLGQKTAAPNKDGDIFETLHYIANNLGVQTKSSNIALATTAVITTLTTIIDIICADFESLSLRLSNTGSVSLNDLQIQGFETVDFPFDYQLLASAGLSTSYSTDTGKQSGNLLIPVVDVSGTLPAIPASGKSGILINCKYFQRIRVQASVASGTTNIAVAGTLMS